MKVNGIEILWPAYTPPGEAAVETPLAAATRSTPCKRGHNEGRYKAGACIVCVKAAAAAWKKANPRPKK